MSVLRYFDPSVRRVILAEANHQIRIRDIIELASSCLRTQEVRGLISLIYVPLLC